MTTIAPHLALNALRQALSARDTETNALWLERIKEARSATPVSLKRWLADKPSIELAQVTINADGKITGSWIPGRRDVSVRASSVIFDGSIQEFSGMRHLFHSDNVLIVESTWGDLIRLHIYAA